MKKIKLINRDEMLDGAGPELSELTGMIERLSIDKIKKFKALATLIALLKPYTQDELWHLVGYCEKTIRDNPECK